MQFVAALAFRPVARDARIGLAIPLAGIGDEFLSPDQCNVRLDIIVDIGYNSNKQLRFTYDNIMSLKHFKNFNGLVQPFFG